MTVDAKISGFLDRCGDGPFLQNQAHWVKTYGRGRVCAHTGCHTRLSAYNPGDYCGLHQPAADCSHYLGYRVLVCQVCGETALMGKGHRDRISLRCGRCGAPRKETP